MRELLMKRIYRDSVLYHPLAPAYRRLQRRQWERAGRPKAVPQGVKEQMLTRLQRAYGLRVLVETGTWRGDMPSAMRRRFARIYTVELQPDLHKRAVGRLARWPHITPLYGDSADVLPVLLQTLREPCLLWLDAHYSGGVTARGPEDTPIGVEFEAVWARPPGDVILVDDAANFSGENGYPTLNEVEELVRLRRPDLAFDVRDGMILLTPSLAGAAAPRAFDHPDIVRDATSPVGSS